jgi:hypothetical protein
MAQVLDFRKYNLKISPKNYNDEKNKNELPDYSRITF